MALRWSFHSCHFAVNEKPDDDRDNWPCPDDGCALDSASDVADRGFANDEQNGVSKYNR